MIKPEPVEMAAFTTDRFTEFEDAETYQVNIAAIKNLTKLSLSPAPDVYEDNRLLKLILEEVDIAAARVAGREAALAELGYRISNLMV